MKNCFATLREQRLFGDPVDRPVMLVLSDDLMVVQAAFYTDTFENVKLEDRTVLRNHILYKEHLRMKHK